MQCQRICVAVLWCLCALGVEAATDPLAVAFGTLPEMYGAQLAPDGEQVSYLSTAGVGMPVLFVTDRQGNVRPALASKAGDFDIYWCAWANPDRLLCGFYGIGNRLGLRYPVTRLVAVNSDGSDQRVLLQRRQARRSEFAQFQDDIVDWLPDDPQHILIETPESDGTGVGRVNIYDGKVTIEEHVRSSVREWLSDGYGRVRVRLRMDTRSREWQYRDAAGERWQSLYESQPGDDDDFYPLGFGESRDELLVLKPAGGRLGLWAQSFDDQIPDRLVFSHPAVDAEGLLRIGRYRRLAGISYVTDSPHMYYFDAAAEDVMRMVSAARPAAQVSLVDESWDRSVYLLHLSSPDDAGRYYLLNRDQGTLAAFWPEYPGLEGRPLAEMRPAPYAARDGVEIPAYLTLPSGGPSKDLPTVLLPHGGPESRDYLSFDFLAQFLAARGYAVLQSNYRGSGGYGQDWTGEGGFKAWRQAIDDLTDGTRALIDTGVADPQRICAVGWSYGGYAALLSVLEEPQLYRCVVSIAGVTDPQLLVRQARQFLNRRWVQEYVGEDEEVMEAGSPLRRAEEFNVPVLLFHGDEDINVDVDHSRQLHKNLKRHKKDTALVIYKDAAHSLWRSKHRIDMLDRLGKFLDKHTRPQVAAVAGD